MRRLNAGIGLILICSLSFGQLYHPEKVQYGLKLSSEWSGSGHGTNLAMNFVASNDFKGIEVGILFDNDNPQQVKGGEFKYNIFFGKKNYFVNGMQIKPFFLYNCIYQMDYSFENSILVTPTATYEIPDEGPGKISTMEHYAAVGTMFKFKNKFYFDFSMGMGAYIGSIKKSSTPSSIGVHKTNHGFTSTFKIGVGYNLF